MAGIFSPAGSLLHQRAPTIEIQLCRFGGTLELAVVEPDHGAIGFVIAPLVDFARQTVTGSGGIGKTSLAAAVARRLADRGGAEVWWCDLVSAADDDVVFERLWRHLGLSVDWSLTYATIGRDAQRVSQVAFLRVLTRGQAY